MQGIPNIAVIGVAKAGTTSMASWLEAHPDVAMARIKESNFFATDIDLDRFTSQFKNLSPQPAEAYWASKPLKPLHGAFVKDANRYQRLFEHASPGQSTADCSPSYFFSEQAPEALKKSNPQAKVILILRNPIDRAYSHYLMARKYGMVKGDFLEELAEDQVKQPVWGNSENIYHLSCYAEGLKRWQMAFPDMKVCLYEELFQSEQWDSLCDYLQISRQAGPSTVQFQGKESRRPGINAFVMHHPIGKLLQHLIPAWLRSWAIKRLTKPIDSQSFSFDRKAAWRYFHKDVAEVEALLGRPLSLWPH